MVHTETNIEFYKQVQDYLKHLTTLSTGSIIVTATFWDKISSTAEWIYLVCIAIIAFMVSVVCSVICMTINVDRMAEGTNSTDWLDSLDQVSLYLCWISFLVAVCSLCVFILKNLN